MIISKIKANFVTKDLRFNSSFFLNQDAINSRILEENRDKCLQLSEIANVFNPPIFKRQFCQNTQNAILYCQSSDVTNMLEGSEVFINKAQAVKVGTVVKKNQVLVTGFGTIGNVKIANELTDGISYANNVCRIEANTNQLFGFIYAFMASKYGKSQLNKNGSGSVVKYIEAPGIKKTLIPVFDNDMQEIIHNLIIEASKLRVEANKLLNSAISLFENKIEISKTHNGFQYDKVSSCSLKTSHMRLDGQYQLLWKSLIKEQISKTEYIPITQLAKNIFVGGRGKRMYIENGIPFLSSSDMLLYNPKRNCKKVSKKTPGLNTMLVSKYDILISRSGTVGNAVIVGDDLSNTAISEHALRLVIDKDKISPNYVYCYLKTTHGKRCLEASSFGSVIITLNEDLIGNIDLPILDKETMNLINERIENFISKMDLSTLKENQAIDLIEKEIESWQKS